MRKAKNVTTAAPVVLVYLRVSTARQAEDGISLEAQEAKCRAYAERMGWPVLEVFRDEGISGKENADNRPGLKALLARFKATPGAVVVVYSVSRLARRQRLLWDLLDEHEGHGLRIASATEPFETATPTGRAMLGMLAVFAQLTADIISENTRDALSELKDQGVKLGNKGMTVLDPQVIVTVKELYATGAFSQRSLVDELNRRGTPTATGKGKWHLRTVQQVLAMTDRDVAALTAAK